MKINENQTINAALIKMMIKVIPFLSIFISSCTSNTNYFKAGDKIITFENVSKEKFWDSNIIEHINYLPLETNDDCLLSDDVQLKSMGNDYYILDNKAHHKIFRFNSEGIFLNTIGQRGQGPNEYNELLDFTVDERNQTIEVLVFPEYKIFRYEPDGKVMTTIKNEIPAQSFAKLGDTYYLNIGYSNYFSKERIYKVNDQGVVISKYHPITTRLFPVTEPNFTQTDRHIIFHESFSNTIYDVTNEDVEPLYTIDFGKYSIPDDIHKIEPMQVLEILERKGMCMIVSYYENSNFVYFFVSQQELQEITYNHLLIDKKTGNKRILYFTEEKEDGYGFFGRAEMLTDNDELIFLVQQAPLIDLIEKHSFFKGNLTNPLNDELNPVIAKVKLQSF